ncbi:hypothetical protein PsorP6_007740 [Peronosclerospora sorghi]|uniref:Uncharacterized protein n=1 Tax=Peronosclerospora sorghi TaxID=230839 RepID=A0ACC0W820_9STRA|nr:hypothetical protein PsorP6_007740 [Peronosclerospora sorghi]
MEIFYPYPSRRDRALSFAQVDLYLRVHAPKIYHDPIKIATLSGLETPSCFHLGEHYDALLPEHVAAAVGLLTSTTQDMEDADMDLFSQFILVAIQETTFSSSEAVRRVTHFSKVCESMSISFWSHPTTQEFSVTRGRDGVGLLLSGKHPFQTNVLQLDSSFPPPSGCDRKDFFDALPTRFLDDFHHLVMGYFNVPMDPILDEVIPYMHDLGRAEFIAWQLRLGITDAWRNWWPDKREFTGPGRKKRIDYAVPSGRPPTCYIYNQFSKTSSHCTAFLKTPSVDLTKPINCVKECVVMNVLIEVDCLTNTNEQTLFFLRKMVHEFKNHELENHRYLRQRLYDAETAHIHSPNEITTRNIADATAELETFVEEQNARRQQVKFDFDVRCGETGGKTFFRTPYSSDMRVTIPNVR